ncbi:hypothetical protein [Planctomicrobium sp. SH664]|uniref:hypothetical protein n=1 Tax=Planctomicrobium sp. SH664 TaxID=3448125 RepID=UPI003F5AF2AC
MNGLPTPYEDLPLNLEQDQDLLAERCDSIRNSSDEIDTESLTGPVTHRCGSHEREILNHGFEVWD